MRNIAEQHEILTHPGFGKKITPSQAINHGVQWEIPDGPREATLWGTYLGMPTIDILNIIYKRQHMAMRPMATIL